MIKTENTYKNASWVLYSFVLFNVISYLYVIFNGTYNGDFLNIVPKLSHYNLFLNLLLTLFPFFVLYAIYKHYIKVDNKYKVSIPTNSFGLFLLLVIVFQIVVTILYGVGILGQETYKAPIVLKLFIQVFNRFDVIFGVSIYSIIVSNKNKFQYILWILVFTLSLFRTSFMIFIIIGFMIIFIYFGSISAFLKKHLLITIVFLIVSPIVVSSLYNVRKQLRQNSGKVEIKFENHEANTFSKVIFGQLVGRLSSYSNSAVIQERKGKIRQLTSSFSPIQYQKEALSAFYGKIINEKDILYRNLLYESVGNHSRTYSAMNGIQGTLLISSYQSYPIFFLNLFTILLIVVFTFELVSLFHNKNVYNIVFLFFCFTLMSGNADAYMKNFMSVLLYLILFLFLNQLKLPKSN